MPEKRRQGYPVAILIGLSEKKTVIWRIFSESAKLNKILDISDHDDKKQVYRHHELIIYNIQSMVKSGIKCIIIVSPSMTRYSYNLLDHVKKRHRWLVEGDNKMIISEMTGIVETPQDVHNLVKGTIFKKILNEITVQESLLIKNNIEKKIQSGMILYTIDEIYKEVKNVNLELIVMTEMYYEEYKKNQCLQSILQLSQNNYIKTRIVKGSTSIGVRVQQFGGLIGIIKNIE